MPRGLYLHDLLHEPERLQPLREAPGGMLRHMLTSLCDSQKLPPAGGIGCPCGLITGQGRVSVRVVDDRLAGYQYGLQEPALITILRIAYLKPAQRIGCLPHDTAQSLIDHTVIVDIDMAHAIIIVVSRCEEVVIHGPERLRRHV